MRKRLGSVLAAAALSCAAIVTAFVVSWMSCNEGEDGCGVGLLVAAAAVVPAFLLGGAALILLSERTSSPILTNVITALAVFFALIPLEMVFLRQIWAVFAFSGLFAVFVAMVLSEPGVTTLEREIRTHTSPAPSVAEPDPAPASSVAVMEEWADLLAGGPSLSPPAVAVQGEEPVSPRQKKEQSHSPTIQRKHRKVAHRHARTKSIPRQRRALRRRREPPPEAVASPVEGRLQELADRIQSLVERVDIAGKESGSDTARPAAFGAEGELRLICLQAAALLSRINGGVSASDLELQLLAIGGLRRRLLEVRRQLEDGETG